MNTDSYKDEHGPSERVIEAMADCLLKTPNCVTREEIIAAWRVAVSALSEQIRAMPRYDCARLRLMSHDTPICPECGAGPEKQCGLRFLAANCPRRKSIESETRKPIPMMLFCPRCHEQHVDAPEPEKGWTNPPHATHTCQHCGTLWRPSNHNTTGVFHIGVLEPKHGARIAACWPSSAALEYQRPGDEIRAELRNGSVVYFGSAETPQFDMDASSGDVKPK